MFKHNTIFTVIIVGLIGMTSLTAFVSLLSPDSPPPIAHMLLSNAKDAFSKILNGDLTGLLDQWLQGVLSLIFFALLGLPAMIFANVFTSVKTAQEDDEAEPANRR